MYLRTRLSQRSIPIDLTPLVDVLFLVLIFFFFLEDSPKLPSLPIESPSLQKMGSSYPHAFTVTLDRYHSIYLEGDHQELDLSTLKNKLEHAQAGKPSVLLNADRRASYEAFLQLFSTLQECCATVYLAYHTEEGTPP